MKAPAYTYSATVVRWVDGDTVDLDVDLGFHMHARTRFRLYGIDTPERGRAGYGDAKDAVNALAPVGSTVAVQSFKDAGKFGRWLALITPAGDAESINTTLVANGLAAPYGGGPA